MSTAATLQPENMAFLPPPSLIAGLDKRGTQLQMLPSVAIEAMRVAMDLNCSFAKYATIVERDLKLATEILTVTNSAAYNPTSPIVSLKHAVVRLGLRKCQNLILTSSITSMMRRISLEQERICCILWNHSFNTATLATSLNNVFHLGFQGEEFTAGLIHDIGRTLLAVADPEQFAKCDSLSFEEPEASELLAQEEVMIGSDHCRFGAWYAIQQKLPAPFPEVILHHHCPESATEHQRLVSLIAVADHMSNHLQRFNESAGYDPYGNPFVPTLGKFCDSPLDHRFADVCLKLMNKSVAESTAMGGSPTKQLLTSNLRDNVVQSMFSNA